MCAPMPAFHCIPYKKPEVLAHHNFCDTRGTRKATKACHPFCVSPVPKDLHRSVQEKQEDGLVHVGCDATRQGCNVVKNSGRRLQAVVRQFVGPWFVQRRYLQKNCVHDLFVLWPLMLSASISSLPNLLNNTSCINWGAINPSNVPDLPFGSASAYCPATNTPRTDCTTHQIHILHRSGLILYHCTVHVGAVQGLALPSGWSPHPKYPGEARSLYMLFITL